MLLRRQKVRLNQSEPILAPMADERVAGSSGPWGSVRGASQWRPEEVEDWIDHLPLPPVERLAGGSPCWT